MLAQNPILWEAWDGSADLLYLPGPTISPWQVGEDGSGQGRERNGAGYATSSSADDDNSPIELMGILPFDRLMRRLHSTDVQITVAPGREHHHHHHHQQAREVDGHQTVKKFGTMLSCLLTEAD